MISNSLIPPQLLCSTLLALSLAKQSRWNPVKDKRSPDGFGFAGRHRTSHRTFHRTSHGGGRSASSGYGAPPPPPPPSPPPVAAAAPAQAGYGQPRAPACRTEVSYLNYVVHLSHYIILYQNFITYISDIILYYNISTRRSVPPSTRRSARLCRTMCAAPPLNSR